MIGTKADVACSVLGARLRAVLTLHLGWYPMHDIFVALSEWTVTIFQSWAMGSHSAVSNPNAVGLGICRSDAAAGERF